MPPKPYRGEVPTDEHRDRPAPRRAVLILAAVLSLTPCLARAGESRPNPPATAGGTTADLLLARPGGAVATVLGTAIFVVGLPFTLINGSTEQAAQTLIVQPANYTFARPLGQDIGGLGDP